MLREVIERRCRASACGGVRRRRRSKDTAPLGERTETPCSPASATETGVAVVGQHPDELLTAHRMQRFGWMWWNRAPRKEADTAGRACPAATIVPRRLGNTATNAPRRRGTFAVIEWSSSQVERQHRAAADRPDDEPAEAHDDAALVQHGHRRHRSTPARRVLGRRTWLGNRLRQPGRGSARGAERSRRSHSGAAVRAQPPPQAPTRTDCISISTQTIKETRCSGSSTSALAAPTSASAT